MNKEEKITISVNEEDVQNIINAYEKDIEYINQLEKENKQLKDNWNKLREWIKVRDNIGFEKISLEDIVYEMVKLEQGSDSK